MVDYSTFAQRFPELASTKVERQRLINLLLQEAADDCNQALYGSKWGRAVLLLSAHRLVLQERAQIGGSGGAVQSLSVSSGSNSVTFAQAEQQDSSLTATVYGRLFLALRQSLPLSGFVI